MDQNLYHRETWLMPHDPSDTSIELDRPQYEDAPIIGQRDPWYALGPTPGPAPGNFPLNNTRKGKPTWLVISPTVGAGPPSQPDIDPRNML